MASVRLSEEIEDKIISISNAKNISKSDIIKEALELYIAQSESQKNSFELGSDLFGQYGSGKGNLSRDYKKLIKDKIRAE